MKLDAIDLMLLRSRKIRRAILRRIDVILARMCR